jgi:filamentous hemagglutinin family protein
MITTLHARWCLRLGLVLSATTVQATGIVSDGGTATSVSATSSGHQTVSIAPAIGGVSHNTYSSFNVTSAGADLNNVGVNANTIVNQVTSTNQSLIQGAISVLGPRANVILANPNGITVDGGRFVNSGHVVLSTGQVAFPNVTLPSGATQRNVVLTTNGGTITIGPGGLGNLSDAMVNLDLIAKQLVVNGPVTNPYTSSTGGIRAIVGDSTNTYDTGFSPGDNGHDWLTSSTSPGTSSSGIAVDITALGGLTAGRVELIVTDKGAGVRNLGTFYATAGDVVVSANGDVGVIDGSIRADEGNISVATPGAVSLQGALLDAPGSVTVNSNGITLASDASGVTKVTGGNAVSLTSAGGIASTDSVIQASGIVNADGSTSGGDVMLSAGVGDVSVTDGSVTAAHNIQITTPGALSVQGTQVSAANNVTVNANGIAFADDATGQSILSADNAVSLTSAGDIANTGSRLQAGTVAADGTLSGDGLTLNATGSIINRSTPENLGIIFAAGGVLSLSAQSDITNDNARILGNQGVNLAAQGDVSNIIDHTGGTDNGQPVAYSHTGGSFLFFTHTTSGFDVDYGSVNQPDQLASIVSTGGPVTISGRNVSNSGGLIQSNDGDVSINAQQAFTNAAVFAGQASYAQSCWIFCHANASSNVTPYGGTIQTGGNVAITAGTSASNIGGNVHAGGNLDVTAPVTYAQGVTGYSAINQDRGFKAFFGSTWAQIIATDVGGGFTADGLVTLTGDAIIDGGYISGGKGASATGGITTVRAPSTTPVQIGQHLGLTTWLEY